MSGLPQPQDKKEWLYPLRKTEPQMQGLQKAVRAGQPAYGERHPAGNCPACPAGTSQPEGHLPAHRGEPDVDLRFCRRDLGGCPGRFGTEHRIDAAPFVQNAENHRFTA